MRAMDADSVDAVVTDPPYELAFMGKRWDAQGVAFQVATWGEALRVLKPGGHLLAFGGTRTSHRMVCAIEDAGFEIRDSICWLYGSGFPKSLDVSKALDKAAGAEREVVGREVSPFKVDKAEADRNAYGAYPGGIGDDGYRFNDVTAPATDLARQWDGWGTALKPAYEPIVMARKPLIGSVAANVARYGTGGINVDGCRVEITDAVSFDAKQRRNNIGGGGYEPGVSGQTIETDIQTYKPEGRWPANVLLGCACEGDGHDPDCAAAMLDAQSGETKGCRGMTKHGSGTNSVYGKYARSDKSFISDGMPDTGGASRFFYTAKASRAERNKGLDGMPEQECDDWPQDLDPGASRRASPRANHHPTVKPLNLMQWLCRLVTPKGGTVLDPFCGSGSTLIAADREGFNGIGIEQDAEYAEIAKRRCIGDSPLFAQVAD
jgi:DNA modification methylase